MSYILIEDMKLEVKSGFKSTLKKNMWGSHPTYKIKIDVENDQYEKVISLSSNKSVLGFFKRKEGDINYIIKMDGKYYTGKFDIISIQGLSKNKNYRTLQLEVGNLSIDSASIEMVRDLSLTELLS